MDVPTERQFRTFNSWDEVSPGDTLLWIVDGKFQGTAVEFLEYDEELSAKILETSGLYKLEDYSDDNWCDDIYPNHRFTSPLGWVIEQKIFKYDPTQQPEDDSI